MILYPAIDLINGECVRLAQGRFDAVTKYDSDPFKRLDLFNAEHAQWVHIVDLDGAKAGSPQQHDLIGRLDGQLKEEGYFQLSHDWKLDLPLMAGTIRRFSADGISPVFAFLFDEFWAPFHALDALLGGVLGRYAMLPDFWAWNVDPQKGESGWAPHRDQGRVSLAPDGAPLSLTCWIPLTEATPLNGCMYIVPAAMDPVYGTPQEKDHHRVELSAARALPAKPGDFLVWNQAVLHWGGRTSRRAEHSRVSMAMEFQRQDIEPFNLPLLPPGTILLAGHTHCGQVVLPLYGSLLPVSRFGDQLRCGVHRLAGRTAIVTAGLGTSGGPFRIGAPPDLWLLTVGG